MKEKLKQLFYGRQGMDELSKAMFWWALAGVLLSILLSGFLNGVPSSILFYLGLLILILSFVRAFSRSVPQRELENDSYLAFLARRVKKAEAKKDRFRQRKEYVFFKCPGCGTYIRVPRGKGTIHINCRCGYTLYRKT